MFWIGLVTTQHKTCGVSGKVLHHRAVRVCHPRNTEHNTLTARPFFELGWWLHTVVIKTTSPFHSPLMSLLTWHRDYLPFTAFTFPSWHVHLPFILIHLGANQTPSSVMGRHLRCRPPPSYTPWHMALLLQSGHVQSYITHVCENATHYLPPSGLIPSKIIVYCVFHIFSKTHNMLPWYSD